MLTAHLPSGYLVARAMPRGIPALMPAALIPATLIGAVLPDLHSIGGGMRWGAPVSDHLFALVKLPATRSHRVWSFIFHWTFALELAIWAAAVWLWLQRKRT